VGQNVTAESAGRPVGVWVDRLPRDQSTTAEWVAPPDTNNVGERIDGIDQALTTAPPLVEEATVFRGMDLRGFTPEVGATFTDQAFISTSMDLSVAEKFSERAIGDGASAGDVAIAEIRVPPGTRGVPMFKVWEARMGKDGPVGKQMAREREIILNRGSRFRVTKVGRDSKGVVRLALELLPKAA